MPGFKKLQVGEQTFDTLLNQDLEFYNDKKERGSYDPVSVNYEKGSLKMTDRPLDFAIQGDGFFAVQGEGQQLYTRNGEFHLTADGRLLNNDGFPVIGENGAITIPTELNPSQLLVGADGTIRDRDNGVIDQLRVVAFDDMSQLDRVGTTLFKPGEGQSVKNAGGESFEVVHRALETSNTTIYEEMAEMISCMRAFEANSNMLKSHDENETRMITSLST